jgi:precorrin-2 dehydrogenase/sirohydrochlorin ferrochelatase
MALYPVNLKIEGRLCIIVGGGPVALRKALGLLAAGGLVRVISPEVVLGLRELAEAEKIEWFERIFAEGDLEDAFLVYSATDSRVVQAAVGLEAEKYGALLNSADDPQGSHFHIPAHFRRGPMLMTVSTGGGSPALSRKLREKMEAVIVPGYEGVIELLGAIREEVLANSEDQAANGELFRTLLQEGLVDLVLESNWFDLQMFLLEKLPECADSVAILKEFLEKHDQS